MQFLFQRYSVTYLDALVRYFLEDGKIWLRCPDRNFLIPEEDFRAHETLKFQFVR